MSLVEVRAGVRLHVEDRGSGTAVVLVPGIGLTHEAWRSTADVLVASGLRVVSIDQRGHGASDKPSHGYDIGAFADDLLGLLHALRITECALVGWSFGGQVALEASGHAAGLVSRLVLVGSCGVRASRSAEFPFGAPAGRALQSMLRAERRDRVVARRNLIRMGFATDPDAELLDDLVRQSLRMPSSVAEQCYATMLETDLTARLDQLEIPLALVMGALDPVHPLASAEWVRERRPGTRLFRLADCAHYPMFEAPDSLAGAVLGALA